MRVNRYSAVDLQRMLIERQGISGAKTASDFIQSLRRRVKVRSPADITPSPEELAALTSKLGRIDVQA